MNPVTNPQEASILPPSPDVIEPTTAAVALSGHGSDNHPKLKFNGSDRFLRELRRRVDEYFERTGRRRRDCPQMYFKTATIMTWFTAAYLLLLLVVTSWWAILPLAIVLGLSMAAIGLNIQHDGGHKAYSNRPWVNKMMALSLDLMGGSSYFWNWKHNAIHHTYTNINGHDDDINVGFLGRLSPEQKRLFFHRFQGFYVWVLYGFLAIKWHFVDDFKELVTGRIGNRKIPRPRGKDLLIFLGGKGVFFFLAFGLPILLHPVWPVLLVYAAASFTSGVALSIVFQLAHCVEQAEFPIPVTAADGTHQIENEWAVHQVQTTVNFSRSNRVLGWFLGGLNFQIEHHLLSRICHVRYHALSKVVEQTCRDFNIRYAAHKSFFSAIASHFRWLDQMGRPTRGAN